MLPNLVTLSNLLSGCIAIYCISQGWYGSAFLCFVYSILADFADGLVARAVNASGELGKQLDSLADMVSFGVAPGFVLFTLISIGLYGPEGPGDIMPWAAFPGLLFTAFACYRLAKFNIDERQTTGFRGLATPGATVFVYGMLMAYSRNEFNLADFLSNPIVGYVATLLIGILMVSDLKMFSFKVKNAAWKGNELRYSFIFAAILLIVFMQYTGLALCIVLYVLLSMLFARD